MKFKKLEFYHILLVFLNRKTSLHLAVEIGNIGIIKLLLNHKCINTGIRNDIYNRIESNFKYYFK